MEKSVEIKMKERLSLINKIQEYLKENKKDGLLIYEKDYQEPYFKKLIGMGSSNDALLYIPAEEKPKGLISNLEFPAVKSTGIIEEKNITEYKLDPFSVASKPFLKNLKLKGKKVLVNFSEKDPLVDQMAHSFITKDLQGIKVESSEELWKAMKVKGEKAKEYNFTTSSKVRKTRVEGLKNKIAKGQGYLMVNGIGQAASESYASYLIGFLKNQKYIIAAKQGKAMAIVHKDEVPKNHLFDKVLTYETAEELKKIVLGYFKDVEKVFYDTEITEGNYRLIKNILGEKLKDPSKNLVNELLTIKLPEEVEEMKKACKINDKIFDYLEKELKAGMSEKEIAKLIEKKAFSYLEVISLSFPSLVAAGENGANVHHVASDYRVKKDDLLLVDLGVRLKSGMLSDTTCMFYFGDSIPERVKKYDKVMDDAMLAVFNKIGPGKSKFEADLAARNVITEYYPVFEHGAGHGTDTRCHGRSDPMSPRPEGFFGIGEVFTDEPGIYIPKEKVSKKHPRIEGFRKEIMVYITDKGVEKISEIPKLRLIKR